MPSKRAPPVANGLKRKIPKAKEAGSGEFDDPDGVAAPHPYQEYPFYLRNKFTAKLEHFAKTAVAIEQFKDSFSAHAAAVDAEHEATKAVDEADEILQWFRAQDKRFRPISEYQLFRQFAALIAKGDTAGLQDFAEAQKAYEDGFGNLSNKDIAKVHLMIACDLIWEEGRARIQVKKAEIKARACELWAKSVCRRKGRNAKPEHVRREQGSLPHVNWPLIFKEIGLSDIRPAKKGRKKIGNKRR
jgi:hypothetical protein